MLIQSFLLSEFRIVGVITILGRDKINVTIFEINKI